MGEVHPLSKALSSDAPDAEAAPAEVRSIDSARCDLCGAELSARELRHHLVSPRSCDDTLIVCRTCRQAALGEGYRPAD